jgi:hypothetical protein
MRFIMSRIPHYGRMFRRVGPVVTQDVREPVAVVVSAPVAAPASEDWRSLSWPQKRSLAASLTDEPIRNGADADRVIAAHKARQS